MTTRGITTHKPVTGKDGKVRLVAKAKHQALPQKIAASKRKKFVRRTP